MDLCLSNGSKLVFECTLKMLVYENKTVFQNSGLKGGGNEAGETPTWLLEK